MTLILTSFTIRYASHAIIDGERIALDPQGLGSDGGAKDPHTTAWSNIRYRWTLRSDRGPRVRVARIMANGTHRSDVDLVFPATVDRPEVIVPKGTDFPR